MKSAQIRSCFWSVFPRIRTEYIPGKTAYLNTFHAVKMLELSSTEPGKLKQFMMENIKFPDTSLKLSDTNSKFYLLT